jgi:hypothetical protein
MTIPEQNEPGLSPMGFSLPMNLTGQGLGRDPAAQKKIFLARTRSEILFYAILHYEMRGQPAQARVRPEPSPKN